VPHEKRRVNHVKSEKCGFSESFPSFTSLYLVKSKPKMKRSQMFREEM